MKITFDARRYREGLRAYMKQTNRDIGDVLREEMGYMVKACILLTPPFSGKQLNRMLSTRLKPGEQFDGSARQVGERAVEHGIRRVFIPVTEMDKYQTSESFRKAADRRDSDEIIFQLRNAKRFSGRTAEGPDKGTHNAAKGSRTSRGGGRVRQGAQWLAIWDASAVKSYIQSVQKRVGTAKSGWNKAALTFPVGRKQPGWISTKHGRGDALDLTRTNKNFASATNLVPWIQWAEDAMGITRLALASREKAVIAKVKHEATKRQNLNKIK